MTTHATEARLDADYVNKDWRATLEAVFTDDGDLRCADPATCGTCAIYAPALPGEGRDEHGRRLVERMARAGDVARRWERTR